MVEGLLYLLTSFWLGAVHAATPGHGKTIAASYIVGARGRPVDALVLGIFVTLSHTSGIILVAVLASLGSAWLVPHRVEAYLALGTGLLVVGIGCWLLRAHVGLLPRAPRAGPSSAHEDPPGTPGPAHPHDPPHAHAHQPGAPLHRHGWGPAHTHDVETLSRARPSLGILLGLGIAGGLLPDPAALAILLSAIASGRLVLGLLTVLVFSIGFASVLVLVGVVAARVGQAILDWLTSRWIAWIQIGAALVIVGVGLALTAGALRGLAALA